MNTGASTKRLESLPALGMSEEELVKVLRNSLYPGAQDESIKMVIWYCRASGLDPMQKPVHIVPISVKQGDSHVMRDVIMPGIGLYRTQASRTGQYAGVPEPEFGPSNKIPIKRRQWNNAHKGDKSFTMVDDGEMSFPEWCRVTVKRLMDNGSVAEFTSKELWLENYATAGNDTTMPNAMWKRRPFAQLAKCAEAQALRKAFPELGAAPTADEMEGREIEINEAAHPPNSIKMPSAKSAPNPSVETIDGGTGEVITKDAPGATAMAEPGEVVFITTKLNSLTTITPEEIMKEAGITTLDALTKDGFNALREAIKGKK